MVRHGPARRHLSLLDSFSVGAIHRDSKTQHFWSWLMIHASRVPRAKARGEPSAQCISPSCFPKMRWTLWNRSYAKHLQQRVNVVQVGEICIVWFWKWFFFFFFCLCRALFQVLWFYFSCVSSLCSEELQCLPDLPLGNTKWARQTCLFYHLKYDLSFPIISD